MYISGSLSVFVIRADIPYNNGFLLAQIVKTIGDFCSRALPSVDLLLYSPLLVLYAVLCAWFVSYLKRERDIRTAYTRKIFHFLIFTMAGVLQIFLGLSGVVLFGILVSLVIIFGLIKGQGYTFYEALARPKDEPHRSTFIIIPLITTAAGGVIANLLFYPFAFIGYFVCGWGDAIGELVGAAWGKHQYKVPSWWGVKATRSIEGSLSIFILGSAVTILALLLTGYTAETSLFVGFACGITGTLVEAISTHGFDNLTVQILVSGVAYFLLH